MIFTLGTIEIQVPDCPAVPTGMALGVPSWVVGWSIFVLILFLIGVGCLIAMWIDEAPNRLDKKRQAAKDRLDAQIRMSENHRACNTCGDKYEPAIK